VVTALLFYSFKTFFVLLSVIIAQQGNNNCVLLIFDDEHLRVLSIALPDTGRVPTWLFVNSTRCTKL